MDNLTQKIAQAAGITEEQAKKVIEVFREDLKAKSPKALHQEIDNLISGGKFGDSFREKAEDFRQKIEVAARDAGQKAEGIIGEIKEKFTEMFNSGKNTNTNQK
ncbi:MAG: hypothetical protein U0X76_05315 [Bacteroidia bacterium]